MADKNAWKEYLLKSSLPLEQIVTEKVEDKAFYVHGEYPYIRPNEKEDETEFSVDLHARTGYANYTSQTSEKYQYSLNLLLECKYSYPGIKWIFSPNPSFFSNSRHIYALIDKQEFRQYKHSISLPVCTKGVGLYSNGFDPHNISRGLNQLRYAMPNLILQELIYTQYPEDEVEHRQSFICLILVTTAQLYVLKTRQDLDAYHSAGSITDIAEQVSSLIVKQDKSPDLQLYSQIVMKPLVNLLMEGTDLEGGYPMAKHFSGKNLDRKTLANSLIERFIPKDTPVFVVNLDALDNVLESLQKDVLTMKI